MRTSFLDGPQFKFPVTAGTSTVRLEEGSLSLLRKQRTRTYVGVVCVQDAIWGIFSRAGVFISFRSCHRLQYILAKRSRKRVVYCPL